MNLFFGKLTFKRIALILIPGLLAGIVLYLFHPEPTTWTWLSALLTIDLISGVIANQLPSVHLAWQKQNPKWIYLFIIIHALVYPVVLFLVEKNFLILGSLLLILTVKLYSFIRGYYLT